LMKATLNTGGAFGEDSGCFARQSERN
jgi:hypothetical protein